MILAMMGAVVAGAALAQWGWLPAAATAGSASVTEWALSALLLMIGFDLARNREAVARLLRADRYAFLVPLGVVAGTLTGGLGASAVLDLSVGESLAVSAGFGWYSLSAVLLSELRGADLGSIAFLANVSRELLSIALIPLLARRLGPYVAVAPGGATTMDTTLPIIEKYAGEGPAVVGFVNGFLLSALVPVLVPLLLRW